MLRTVVRAAAASAVAALVAACSTESHFSAQSPPPNAGSYRVGVPYQVNGAWYYPREQPDYDETGTASWYGPNFEGQLTASGEVFDSSELTAAHTTLPLPVTVRVTNLENGRSVVLRVNDRGPFVGGRIIDVSKHAAEVLGFRDQGTAHVRVTFLARADRPGAPEPMTAPLAATAVATAASTARVQTARLPAEPPRTAPVETAPRPAAPVRMAALAPVESAPLPPPTETPQADRGPQADLPSPQPAPAAASALAVADPQLYVQAGAFDDIANAERLCAQLSTEQSALSISTVDEGGRPLYRVRLGPFDDIGEANAALARVTELGNASARIVADR